MKKRLVSLLLVLSLLAVPVQATENSTDNFIRNKSYSGQFSDLSEDAAFYDNIAALYEYGLSVGKKDGTFGLNDNITVSQLLIFAGRIRSLFHTGDAEAGAAFWRPAEPQTICEPYLLYLKAEQVLGDELDAELFLPATRGQVAHVLANVLPDSVTPAINRDFIAEAYATHKFILDVDEYTPYQQDILELYRAGISCGSDEQGSFLPDQPITRGSLSAMLTRLIDPALRIHLVWHTVQIPDVRHLTLADLVEPGTYIPTPKTKEEMDESIRYMLAAGKNQLPLIYEDIPVAQARKIIEQAIGIVKTYTEQSYVRVQCTYTDRDNILLTFFNTDQDESPASYRDESMAAAIALHDHLWREGYLSADMTELEKAQVYYIWLCLNCTYDAEADDASLSHLAYSALCLGKAVCDGYTGAYNLLLKLEGIDCTGIYTNDHIWTEATLDGKTYHIDVTWGDLGDTASARYFAMSPELSMLLHNTTLP